MFFDNFCRNGLGSREIEANGLSVIVICFQILSLGLLDCQESSQDVFGGDGIVSHFSILC
jgi:hypothetical protein